MIPDGALTKATTNLKYSRLPGNCRQPRLAGDGLTGKNNSTTIVLSELVTRQVSTGTCPFEEIGYTHVQTLPTHAHGHAPSPLPGTHVPVGPGATICMNCVDRL